MDSIYKLMNKINDQDSLTEKYNVKDEKDLVTLHESLRKPLNEGINLHTTHGTLVLEQSESSQIPINSYVILDNLNTDAMDVLNIKIGSKVKPSQLLGIVAAVYKPTPDYVREYALLLKLLTGRQYSDSSASASPIYKIRVPEPFKATQLKDRYMLIPTCLVSKIDEQDYIDSMNRVFPRKGLDKLIHGKDKKFNAVDGGGRGYFDKKLKNKKNEAFYDYDEEHEELAQEFYERAQEEINKQFNCTGAFLEPSTQMGQGRTFLFADDMRFEGSFDFETGEEYIYDNDFDGFLQLVLNSFKPVVEENLEEGIFDGKAKKEDAYKEIIDTVFKDSEFRNPSASFGNVVKDCLSDWIDSLSSNDTTDERSGNASTYATTFVKQAMMLLKKLNKPTRDTVLEIIRLVRSLKFNNGEERPQSFDNLSDFYKLYINVLGKEKDGFKVQEYLAPMMCNSVKMPLEACIRQLESKHLIKK